MKTTMNLNILLAAFLIFAVILACTVASPLAPSSQPSTIPGSPSQPSAISHATTASRNPQVLGDLGSIKYTLDTAKKVSQTFDINTGYGIVLTVTDAGGYVWKLHIPSDGLLSTQKITMTPFATIDVSQSGAKLISGVQLEPDGLQFEDKVQLSVTPPISNPGVGLIFRLQQDGSDVAFAPTTDSGNTASAWIWHFSPAGYDDGDSAGQDGMAQYAKWAKEDYTLAVDAANQFIEKGPPTPPTPPSISQFCRGTEVNPEEGEAYEFVQSFMDPYSEIMVVLLASMKAISLTGVDLDTSGGFELAQQIMEIAEDSILQVGKQYEGEKPPDRLPAVITAGLQVEKMLQLVGGPGIILPKFISWAETVRDYYLGQLKTNHDYRAFPIILRLEKNVELLGGTDRLPDILSAMTFEVIIDTSFDASWVFGQPDDYESGHVEQHADVRNLVNELEPPDFLWGTATDLYLKYTAGTFTFHTPDKTGTYSLDPGQSYTGDLFLKNWDACVTKTFDVMLNDFGGNETITAVDDNQPVAGASAAASFTQWASSGYMFTVPMQNLNPTLGDQNFSGTGSKAEGDFTSSATIHIVIKHTPQ